MFLNLTDWLLLIATLLIIFAFYGWRANQYFNNRGINHIKPKLLFGNLYNVVIEKTHTAEIIRDACEKYPDDKFTGLYNFMNPIILLRDLDILKRVLVKDFDSFSDHMKFTDETADPYLGASLFSLEGEKWKEMRSSLSPAFTSSKMRGMLPFMRECVDNFMEHLESETKDQLYESRGYVEFEAKNLTVRLANDVIASCAFGINVNSLKDRENTFFTRAKDFITFTTWENIKLFIFFISPFIIKLFNIQLSNKETTTFFEKLVVDNMKMRQRNNIMRQDMIHLLMLAKKGKLNDDSSPQTADAGFATIQEQAHSDAIKKIDWTNEEITAQALIFIFAGLDTVSTTMSIVLHHLAYRPDIQKKLVEEIDEFVQNNNGEIEYGNLNKLIYLDMVVSECLRIWPPILILDRACTKSFDLPPQNDTGGKSHQLKKGDGIWISVFEIHRDPKNYKDPEVFDPERFSEENKPSIDPYAYVPFGMGPRACIGSRFALMEVKMFVVLFLSKFEVVKTPKSAPIRMKPDFFDLIPIDGYWVGAKKRNIK